MKCINAFAAPVILLLLAGCAVGGAERPPGSASGDDRGGVVRASAVAADATPEERAIEKWRLWISRDFTTAWQLLTPGARSAMAQPDYAAMMLLRPLRYIAVRYIDKSCATADSCLLKLEVHYQVSLPRGAGEFNLPSEVSERWIRVDGAWFYAPELVAGRDLHGSE